MLNIFLDNNKIILSTDDSTIKYLLEVRKKETKYLPWQKKWGTVTTTTKVYEKKKTVKGIEYYQVNLGWTGYILNTFRSFISQETYDNVAKGILASNYRTIPFPELRDYQNEDVLHTLKYKRGLFSCYTGYGKTSCIAALAKYFYDMGKNVLIVTPQKKPEDEIIKRCGSPQFNLQVPSPDSRIDSIITAGLLNRKETKDPELLKKFEEELSKYEVVLVDEVEYTINDSGKFLYDRLVNADCMYGFSGTADKSDGELISFANGLDDAVIRNRDLVSYFGPSLVYRLPNKIDVDLIKIKTAALGTIKFSEDDFAANSNRYLNIMTKLFTDPGVCNVIVKTVKKYPMTYIPMNNLASIINTWIEDYFLGVFRVLLICYEGYIYYDLEGNRTKLKDLNEACEYVKNGLVDVIPSTSSGFRALDLPGLENTIVLSGKCAGSVLQAIGRVGRGKHMNIIGYDTISGRKIPAYTKGLENRDEMIKKYYKYCKITESIIYENNL